MMKQLLIGILAISGSLSALFAQPNPLQYVKPLTGTARMGHTFPGATLPFGMVQLSPYAKPNAVNFVLSKNITWYM